MDLVLHYRSSAAAAEELQNELQQQRPDSVLLLQADLLHNDELPKMIMEIHAWRGSP
jgi:pteridine reductase